MLDRLLHALILGPAIAATLILWVAAIVHTLAPLLSP